MVKVTQTDTGVSRSVSSDPAGAFVLANLPLGPYRLEVGKEGFATFLNTGFALEVGNDPGFATLKVALPLNRSMSQLMPLWSRLAAWASAK